MQQSTDHLSNVMAELVMSSAIKATLRKCEEKWRKEGTFHEEDIQHKLEALESLWHKCLSKRNVKLNAQAAASESTAGSNDAEATLRKRARLREEIPRAEAAPSRYAPADFMPPTVPLRDVLVTYHPVPAARMSQPPRAEIHMQEPQDETLNTEHEHDNDHDQHEHEHEHAEAVPHSAESLATMPATQFHHHQGHERSYEVDETLDEQNRQPQPQPQPSSHASALAQFLLSDVPIEAPPTVMQAGFEDDFFEPNVDDYLNELGELDVGFEDDMFSPMETVIPAAARQAMRHVMSQEDPEIAHTLTEGERQELARNVIVEIEPRDDYNYSADTFVDDSAIEDIAIDAYAIGQMQRMIRKTNPWTVRLKDVMLRIGEKDFVYKQLTLKIDAEDFGTC